MNVQGQAEPIEYWRILRKRLWLILLVCAIGGVGAVSYFQRQPPVYAATTTLFLNPGAPILPYQSTQTVQSLANTYAEYMRTRAFADQVAQQLQPAPPPQEILDALTTHYVPDTQFFQITATLPRPGDAAAVANAAAHVLIAGTTARQQQVAAQQAALTPDEQRLRALAQTLSDEVTTYDHRITQLRSQIAAMENQSSSASQSQQLLNLRDELARNETLRVQVLGSLTQAQTALARLQPDAGSVGAAVVVDRAPVPTAPRPRPVSEYILFAMAVLGIAFTLALVLEYLDYTVRTPDELEALYGTSPFGILGVVPSPDGVGSAEKIARLAPQSAPAESFRLLRTNIRFASASAPARSLLVTSTGPGEGKTLIASNLAISLAQDGQRVILVDGDLRRPALHRVFGLLKEPGFSDLVVDETAGIAAHLRETTTEGLLVLTAGTTAPNPAELLDSPRAALLMRQLQTLADVVIYDSPPVAMVTDTMILARRVDLALHVVWAGHTRRDMILRARAHLAKAGVRLLCPVLNRVSAPNLGYYYHYYAGYYHDGRKPGKRSLLGRLIPRSGHR